GVYAKRLEAMRPEDEIIATYLGGTYRAAGFAHPAYSLSDRGDTTHNLGARYKGPGVPATFPAAIFPETKARIASFVEEMKRRGVRVIISHAPYLVDDKPTPGWQKAEALFAADVKDTGAELLEGRDELFFSRADFFDTREHLNEVGRRIRTERVIA